MALSKDATRGAISHYQNSFLVVGGLFFASKYLPWFGQLAVTCAYSLYSLARAFSKGEEEIRKNEAKARNFVTDARRFLSPIETPNEYIKKRVSEIAKEIGLKSSPPVYIMDLEKVGFSPGFGPFALPVKRPIPELGIEEGVVVLPKELVKEVFDDDEIVSIISHEMGHLKDLSGYGTSRDIFFKKMSPILSWFLVQSPVFLEAGIEHFFNFGFFQKIVSAYDEGTAAKLMFTLATTYFVAKRLFQIHEKFADKAAIGNVLEAHNSAMGKVKQIESEETQSPRFSTCKESWWNRQLWRLGEDDWYDTHPSTYKRSGPLPK